MGNSEANLTEISQANSVRNSALNSNDKLIQMKNLVREMDVNVGGKIQIWRKIGTKFGAEICANIRAKIWAKCVRKSV